MKGVLLAFVIGIVAGGFGLYYYQQRAAAESGAAHPAAESAETSAAGTAAAVKDGVADKLAAWRLTPADIKADLARTGQVVRTKAQAAGTAIAGATADTRITATIKAKYTLDADLSAWAISVACTDGRVTLSGTVSSPGLIGKAVQLALDTDGVTQVISTLTVKP